MIIVIVRNTPSWVWGLLAGLSAERAELVRLGRMRLVDEETARKLIREVDLQELRYV